MERLDATAQPSPDKSASSLFCAYATFEVADTLIQHVHLREFARHNYILPRTHLLVGSRRIEGRESKVLIFGLLIVDIESFVPPSLDGLGKLDIEVGGGWVDMDSATTYVIN